MSNIETIRGNSVNKINAEAHTVEFQNGDGVAYHKLLLAIEGVARHLPNFDTLGKHILPYVLWKNHRHWFP